MAEKDQQYASKRWAFLILMLCAFMVTFMTRFVWSPTASTIMPVLQMNNAAAGSMMSAFFIGYVITQIPGGTLVDRVGVKRVLSAGIAITGIATAAFAAVGTYAAGFALRVLTGLGAGVVMSGCTKVISSYFEQKDRGVAFGILLTGPALGLMLANKLGAWLLTAYSWQMAFIVVGLIAIAIAVVIAAAVPNIKSPDPSKITLASGLKCVFTTRNAVAICLAGFFYMFMNLGVSTWANSYLTNLGFEKVTAASVMTVYSLGGILGSLLTGIIVKKFNLSAKWYLVVVYVAIAVLTLLFGFQTSLGVLYAVGFLFGFTTYLPNAHLNSQMLRYVPDSLAASVMGVQNCIFQLASIVAPIVVGWSVDITGNFSACWWVLAGAVLVGIVFICIIDEKRVVEG